jgi:hypothetical protein
MTEVRDHPILHTEAARRSFAITEHDNMKCDLCKGAGSHADEHYKLGKLRFAIGAELGYPREQTRQLDLSTLIQRWHAHRALVRKQKREQAAKRAARKAAKAVRS